MKRNILLIALVLVCCLSTFAQKKETAELKQVVQKYVQSINNAQDSKLADEIWEQNGDVTFVHPRGTEIGWENINKNIYQFFRDYFTQRKLVSSDEKYTVHQNIAVVYFNWVYDATFKKDSKPIQTKGRETKVWKKTGKTWRLVHVHYSGMPVTGETQGF